MATAFRSDRLDVGIDGYNLAMPHGTGVATYGFTLAGTLHRAGHRITGVYGIDAGRDPASAETLFFEALGAPPALSLAERRRRARHRLVRALRPFLSLRARDVAVSGRVDLAPLAERYPPFDRLATAPELFALAMRHFGLYGRFLPLRLAAPPAIMHWTYPVPVHMLGARNIYTLHDLVPLRLPYTTLDAKRRYRKLVEGCAAHAAHLCTVSEASKADIVTQLGVDPACITNTWQASPPPPALFAADGAEDAAAIEGIFGLPRHSYFLYLGAIEPKKNLGRLLEAYLSLGTETPLVIVGGKGWRSESELILLPDGDVRESAHDRSLDHRVRRLSHLPRHLLFKLIRGARAVLFPSLSEGFGLPVLEAMQLGTPVLTSSISALPEVAGDAALLVDPYDVAALASGLARLDRDPALRQRLSAAGPIQAAKFSEPAYRDRLEAMYAAVMAQPA